MSTTNAESYSRSWVKDLFFCCLQLVPNVKLYCTRLLLSKSMGRHKCLCSLWHSLRVHMQTGLLRRIAQSVQLQSHITDCCRCFLEQQQVGFKKNIIGRFELHELLELYVAWTAWVICCRHSKGNNYQSDVHKLRSKMQNHYSFQHCHSFPCKETKALSISSQRRHAKNTASHSSSFEKHDPWNIECLAVRQDFH